MSPADFKTWLNDPHRRPLVMGVLNVTPDSFSDGGRFQTESSAVKHGVEMVAAGAAVLDVGGESTRPGSAPVPAGEQIRRIVPVIRTLAQEHGVLISVDTTRAAVAEAALDAGAAMVNDITAGLDDPGILPLVARRGAPVVLMHMRGRPATMQVDPVYANVTAEAIAFLRVRIESAVLSGVERSSILVDPGIGFGKTLTHNLQLLRELGEFHVLGRPLVVGTSRKGFIGKITGEDLASGRRFGTAATVGWAVTNGAGVVRVHDVEPMSQVVRMIEAIRTVEASGNPPAA